MRWLYLVVCVVLNIILIHVWDVYKQKHFSEKVLRILNIFKVLWIALLVILLIMMMIKFL